jgi:putative protein kinase ArgK-like GTPase of G3E family|tara:strand:+ start:599 stop:859 length:261 start_codon:yes stop_codon:yes gene_type:complete
VETELVAVLSQAPALVIIVWLVMKQQSTNGNGSTELIRTIARSLEKMAEAQAEANRIAEKRAEGFEKWVELQKTQCQQQFVSRNQK